MDVAEAAGSGFSQCLESGAFLVDVIPLRESSLALHDALLVIPTIYYSPAVSSAICPRMVPGSGVEDESQVVCKAIGDMVDIPHQFVED